MTLLKSCLVLAARSVLLVVLASTLLCAQPDNPPPPDDTPVPLTGLEYLLISGGILGGYKMFRNRTKEQK
jgi:hypothetical protein